MTDPRHQTREWRERKIFMDAANDVERAGDLIGPNDMGLSNSLWSAASQIRRFAIERFERNSSDAEQV